MNKKKKQIEFHGKEINCPIEIIDDEEDLHHKKSKIRVVESSERGENEVLPQIKKKIKRSKLAISTKGTQTVINQIKFEETTKLFETIYKTTDNNHLKQLSFSLMKNDDFKNEIHKYQHWLNKQTNKKKENEKRFDQQINATSQIQLVQYIQQIEELQQRLNTQEKKKQALKIYHLESASLSSINILLISPTNFLSNSLIPIIESDSSQIQQEQQLPEVTLQIKKQNYPFFENLVSNNEQEKNLCEEVRRQLVVQIGSEDENEFTPVTEISKSKKEYKNFFFMINLKKNEIWFWENGKSQRLTDVYEELGEEVIDLLKKQIMY